MQTFKGESCTINYNSDLSGDVIITKPNNESIEVPAMDILEFVAYYIKTNKIRQIENMTGKEILGITPEEMAPIKVIVEPANSGNLNQDEIFIGQDVYNRFYNHKPIHGEYVDIKHPINDRMIRLKIQGILPDNVTLITINNLIRLGCDLDKDVVEITPVNPYSFTVLRGS